MPDINITVIEKEARVVGAPPTIICGNSDYRINFAFDDEWDGLEVKTARFTYIRNGQTMQPEVLFYGNTVKVPVISNTTMVSVGVFSGDLITTTPARIACRRSILCGGPGREAPDENLYNQVVDYLNDAEGVINRAKKAAQDCEDALEGSGGLVDDKLGLQSSNPVQNKVIAEEIFRLQKITKAPGLYNYTGSLILAWDKLVSEGAAAHETECKEASSVIIPAGVTLINEGYFYNCTKLKTVYFLGTKDEWDALTIGPGNSNLTEATVHIEGISYTGGLAMNENKEVSVNIHQAGGLGPYGPAGKLAVLTGPGLKINDDNQVVPNIEDGGLKFTDDGKIEVNAGLGLEVVKPAGGGPAMLNIDPDTVQQKMTAGDLIDIDATNKISVKYVGMKGLRKNTENALELALYDDTLKFAGPGGYLAVNPDKVAMKEGDFALIQEVEVTNEETASIAFADVADYKKLYLYATVAPGATASAITGVVRFSSGYGLVNGYVANGINTSTQYYHLCLEKNNGLWSAWFGLVAKEGQDSSFSAKHIMNAKQFTSDSYKVNLSGMWLNTGTSGVYFPIGTKVQLWGVE